jgi:hypothetical protein
MIDLHQADFFLLRAADQTRSAAAMTRPEATHARDFHLVEAKLAVVAAAKLLGLAVGPAPSPCSFTPVFDGEDRSSEVA